MDITIQNKRSPAKTKGNRYYQVFTPQDAQEVVQLHHLGCIGDTEVNHIQLEKGKVPTTYVSPKSMTSQVKGLFSDVQGLRAQMSDKTSPLWSEIIANNKAMILAYHNGDSSAQLGVSADQIRQEVKDSEQKISTQVTQLANSWAVKSLNGNGDVLSAINLATGGASIQAGDNKLVVTPETTYIQNGTIKDAMIENLNGGKITAGSITSTQIEANAITAEHINVTQALFNKLFADEAHVNSLFARQAFITQVQAVDLSASRITSGVMVAQNNAMSIDLNNAGITFNSNAKIAFNSSNNVLYRQRGTNYAFLHFVDESRGGVYAGLGVTSSGDGINSRSAGRFAGIRIFRTAVGGTYSTRHEAEIDQVEIYGDKVLISDDFKISRGFRFNPEYTTAIVDINVWLRSLRQIWASFRQIGYDAYNADFQNVVTNMLSEMRGL